MKYWGGVVEPGDLRSGGICAVFRGQQADVQLNQSGQRSELPPPEELDTAYLRETIQLRRTTNRYRNFSQPFENTGSGVGLIPAREVTVTGTGLERLGSSDRFVRFQGVVGFQQGHRSMCSMRDPLGNLILTHWAVVIFILTWARVLAFTATHILGIFK